MRRVSEILLYGLIFGLPFEYYFRTPEQSLYSSLKLQIVLFLACWIILKIVEGSNLGMRAWRELRHSFSRRLLPALLVFILSQVIAAAFAHEARANAARAAVKTVAGAVVFLAAADLSKEGRLGGRLLAALSLSGLCAALIGLGEHAEVGYFKAAADLFQPLDFRVAQKLRLHSTMEYPTIAGHILSAGLFASLALILHTMPGKECRWRRRLWPAAAALQAMALILTYSRGALGAAILALVFATASFRRYFPKTVWKGIAASFLVLLMSGMGYQLYIYHAGGRDQVGPAQRVARFGLAAAEESKYLSPGREYPEKILLGNTSPQRWARGKFGVGYRWLELTSKQAAEFASGALLLADLLPGQDLEIDVILRTPPDEGEYLLIWYVYETNAPARVLEDSFSPAIVCSVRSSAGGTLSDRASYYVKLIRAERLDFVPTRRSLWGAALRLFWSSPLLGVGPDNFRLLYWRYMEVPRSDERILANSLYLEILSGSGIVGLASLLWMLVEFGLSLQTRFRIALMPEQRAVVYFGTAYFGAFVTHGLADYFLKFTPAFLLFWVCMGLLCNKDTEQPSRN